MSSEARCIAILESFEIELLVVVKSLMMVLGSEMRSCDSSMCFLIAYISLKCVYVCVYNYCEYVFIQIYVSLLINCFMKLFFYDL